MSKTLGEMTPAERDETVRRAVGAFQAELDATAPAIGRILEDAEPATRTMLTHHGARIVVRPGLTVLEYRNGYLQGVAHEARSTPDAHLWVKARLAEWSASQRPAHEFYAVAL